MASLDSLNQHLRPIIIVCPGCQVNVTLPVTAVGTRTEINLHIDRSALNNHIEHCKALAEAQAHEEEPETASV